jgi:hypothetical protein
MFENKWRKRVYYLWIVTIPLTLLAGVAQNARFFLPYSEYVLILGIVVSVAGLIVLKTFGRPGRTAAQ